MANQDIVNAWGLTSRALPSAVNDQNYGPMRLSRRGELMTQDLDRKALADEGTYFIAHNVTNDASTTLAGHPAPVLADVTTFTKPLIVFRNTAGSRGASSRRRASSPGTATRPAGRTPRSRIPGPTSRR